MTTPIEATPATNTHPVILTPTPTGYTLTLPESKLTNFLKSSKGRTLTLSLTDGMGTAHLDIEVAQATEEVDESSTPKKRPKK